MQGAHSQARQSSELAGFVPALAFILFALSLHTPILNSDVTSVSRAFYRCDVSRNLSVCLYCPCFLRKEPMKVAFAVLLSVAMLTLQPQGGVQPPSVDHHQHLYSVEITRSSRIEPLDAADLIAYLDAAGIRRAAVLSVAYQFGNPNRPVAENEYAQVRAENDWTSRQIARFPDRLRGLCGVNPLKDYALPELDRCAADPFLRA